MRLDGHPDHICCSIEYPNAWYWERAYERDQVFKDWTILLIKPNYLWREGTKFSPRNASAANGHLVREGYEAFESLFASEVTGAGKRTFSRGISRPTFLATDDQAEVLVPDRILQQDILGVVVQDVGQAKREIARLKRLDGPIAALLCCPRSI